jgi:hypothetical protein
MVANIVTTTKVNAPEDFYVVKSINSIIDGLPTIIIGYDYVSKHYPDFDITDVKLSDNLYWTFKRTEKRDKHDEDLVWFINKVYKQFTDKVVYVFVDPVQYRGKTMMKIIRKIKSLDNIITYEHGEMLYMYSDNFIFGIDLKLLKYIGFDSDKIKDKVKASSSVFLRENEILIEYKKCINYLNGNIRFAPYLYSIKNGQNDSSSVIHIPRES